MNQQRTQQSIDDIREYIDKQEQALAQQLSDVRSDITKLAGVPGKLATLEECQSLQCKQLNEVLQQISLLVQLVNESRGAGKSNHAVINKKS